MPKKSPASKTSHGRPPGRARVYVIRLLHEKGKDYTPGASFQTTPERAARLQDLGLVSLQPHQVPAKPKPAEPLVGAIMVTTRPDGGIRLRYPPPFGPLKKFLDELKPLGIDQRRLRKIIARYRPQVPPALVKDGVRNRKAETLGALYEALHRNVRRHCPALVEAFDIEVDRIQTERKKNMVWGDEEDPMVAGLRRITINSLRGRRQLKDPHEHLDLLVAHMGFHQCMVMMHRVWRHSVLPPKARLETLERMLPSVAQYLGFTRQVPARDSNDVREITLQQIAQGDPLEAAYLLLSHYSRHAPETVRQYVKRARRAFASQGLSWKKIIQPFPAR